MHLSDNGRLNAYNLLGAHEYKASVPSRQDICINTSVARVSLGQTGMKSVPLRTAKSEF